MNKKFFFFLGFFAILASVSFAQTNNFQPAASLKTVHGVDTAPETKSAINIGSVERAAFRLLNQKRTENGLHSLMWSDDLERVARIHSQNMADLQFFSHKGIDGKMVSDRADCLGVGNWRSIGENIAFTRGFSDPVEKAVDLWLDSPSHRQNLMDQNWKESAVGVAVAVDGSYYFTQVFLLRK